MMTLNPHYSKAHLLSASNSHDLIKQAVPGATTVLIRRKRIKYWGLSRIKCHSINLGKANFANHPLHPVPCGGMMVQLHSWQGWVQVNEKVTKWTESSALGAPRYLSLCPISIEAPTQMYNYFEGNNHRRNQCNITEKWHKISGFGSRLIDFHVVLMWTPSIHFERWQIWLNSYS